MIKALALAIVVFGYAEEMPVHDRVVNNPPIGHAGFCERYKSQCKYTGHGGIPFDSHLLSDLNAVNDMVNYSIRPKGDDPVNDTWEIYVKAGDCEDYALTKRARLLTMGYKSGQLLITTGYTTGGIYHAVLIVKTTNGDYVLDNRYPGAKLKERTEYKWKLQQTIRNPMLWRKMQTAKRPN